MARGLLVVDMSPILARAVADMAGPRLDMPQSLTGPPEHLCDPMPAPQLVILDPAQLRDLGRIVAHLAGQDPDTRVVAFTGRPSLELARYCMEIGCRGFLSKSADTETLVRALRVVVDGGSYIDRVYGRKLLQDGADAFGRALSCREEHILREIARGYSPSAIAVDLSVSVKTVGTHRARAMKKLGIGDRAALVRVAVARGWLD